MSSSASGDTTTNKGITAHLCDSRSCNQMGGGEHLKADIEDLLQVAPGGANSRVTLTTCYGLCNRSPNMKLKSRGGNLLMQAHGQGRLRNDGGLRMRMDNEGLLESQEEDQTTDRVTISEITIAKVARAVGMKGRPNVISAIECKSAGNKCLRDGRYKDALHQFSRGRFFSEQDYDGNLSMACLQASLWLCCASTRVQWASELADGDAEKENILKVAAGDTFRVLTASIDCIADDRAEGDASTSEATETINAVIEKLVRSRAGSETQAMLTARKLAPVSAGDDSRGTLLVPATKDLKTLAQLCVTLADAWCGLVASSSSEKGFIFVDGALAAYTGVRTALSAKARLFRPKERRRIQKAIAALS